jgi:Ca2+-binding EF-hand superfamily protein
MANRSSKIDVRDFETGIKKIGITIPRHNIKMVFNYIDATNDGWIDFEDWLKRVPDQT